MLRFREHKKLSGRQPQWQLSFESNLSQCVKTVTLRCLSLTKQVVCFVKHVHEQKLLLLNGMQLEERPRSLERQQQKRQPVCEKLKCCTMH